MLKSSLGGEISLETLQGVYMTPPGTGWILTKKKEKLQWNVGCWWILVNERPLFAKVFSLKILVTVANRGAVAPVAFLALLPLWCGKCSIWEYSKLLWLWIFFWQSSLSDGATIFELPTIFKQSLCGPELQWPVSSALFNLSLTSVIKSAGVRINSVHVSAGPVSLSAFSLHFVPLCPGMSVMVTWAGI